MKTRTRFAAITCLSLALLAGGAGNALAGEEFVVRGSHWTESSDDQKRAFLAGMVMMIEIEQEMQAKSKATNVKSTVPALVDGLDDMTIVELKNAIDSHYAKNNDLDTPVFHVIWDVAEANR